MLKLAARVTVGTLLVVHGFAHWNVDTAWGARSVAESWLLGPAAGLGSALWIGALAAFALAGVLVFAHSRGWRLVAALASCLSLAVMLLFWQPTMILGVLVDLGILAALVVPQRGASRMLAEYVG